VTVQLVLLQPVYVVHQGLKSLSIVLHLVRHSPASGGILHLLPAVTAVAAVAVTAVPMAVAVCQAVR
jgi:hypothetical protein